MAEPKHVFGGAAQNTATRPEGNRIVKCAVNLSINAEMLKIAREMKLNLSALLEGTLRRVTEEERVRQWRTANRDVTESYNAYIARNGVLGEELLDLDEPPV